MAKLEIAVLALVLVAVVVGASERQQDEAVVAVACQEVVARSQV